MCAQQIPSKHEHTADSSTDTASPDLPGLVIVNYGKHLLVEDDSGTLVNCVSRRGIDPIVCGDRVRWQKSGHNAGVVVALLPRGSVLQRNTGNHSQRPLAANIDQLVIEAATEPVLDSFLLDKYTVAAELAHTGALIVINKADLLSQQERDAIDILLEEYRAIGYTCLYTSALKNTGIDEFSAQLSGKNSILVGQSGVGKSSLIKRLLPDLDITTGKLSVASGQGKHTTTATTLYHLPCGGALIDSPGVRDFKLGTVESIRLGSGFREFHPLLGQCRFNDCLHRSEPGCAITDAVEQGRISKRRMQSYQRLLELCL
jgi:ribosome biogenesis GTPase